MKIALQPEERAALYQLLSKRCQGWVATRARALLLFDLGKTDEEISNALHIGKTFLVTVKKHYVEGGLTRALYLSAAEATLVALAVKPPDNGQKKWTLDLLAERAQLLGIRRSNAMLSQLFQQVNITPFGVTCWKWIKQA